jgi:uncharacterized protein YjbI with pentapeptide repeats
MFAFWWKAAVFPQWGSALAIVTAAVIAMHLTLLFRRMSWILRAVISLCATILVAAVILSFAIPLRRPFNLVRANLSDQWLATLDLKEANLFGANLAGANLSTANLTDAYLIGANLSRAMLGSADLTGAILNVANLNGANLYDVNLSGADLYGADLTDADLTGANLNGANLMSANLSNVKSLTQQQLNTACRNDETQLPPGLSVKSCNWYRQ